MKSLIACMCLILSVGACSRLQEVGKAPSLTPVTQGREHAAMVSPGLPLREQVGAPTVTEASLWSRSRSSLLGDRRALQRGDILTVVIEIDDSAQINNSTERSRSGGENLSVPQLGGLPQRIDGDLPEGASMANAVDITSNSRSGGDGSVTRNERLTLRIAATVTDVLPNGVLSITGSQQVRVNFELRELEVSGFVRPQDISRQNEITYDKIASARISYGGRGQITDMQQPRIGQQVLDIVLPF